MVNQQEEIVHLVKSGEKTATDVAMSAKDGIPIWYLLDINADAL
jgi:hypothetical protein